MVSNPAELVPGCGWTLADNLARTALQNKEFRGVFNLVMGPGSQVGNTLVSSPAVLAISFTGSVGTGRRIIINISSCAARRAKVQAARGGKNPLIVLDDADLNVAINAAVQSAYFSTGQRCTASSRIIVTEFSLSSGICTRSLKAATHFKLNAQAGMVMVNLHPPKYSQSCF